MKIFYYILSLIISFNISARDGLHIFGALEYFGANTKGDLSVNSSAISSYKDTSNLKFKAGLEHEIILLPNFAFEYTGLKIEESGGNYKADYTILDYLLYYDVLAHDSASLHLGISMRQTMINNNMSAVDDPNIFSPQLYVKGKSEIFNPRLSIYGLAKFLGINDKVINEYEVGLGFNIINADKFYTGIYAGYRLLDFDVNKTSVNTSMDVGSYLIGIEGGF